MKYYAKLLAMMAVCAGMASCSSNDEDTTTPQPTAKKVQMTFTGSVDNGNIQRTVMGEDGLSVNFQSGDKISVFDGTSTTEDKHNNEFGTENSGATAKFTSGKEVDVVDKYAILYPYQADASYNGTAITATIPAEQTAQNYEEGNYPTFDPAANVSVATAIADGTFMLKNVCSLIRFNATENCDYVVLSDGEGKAVAGQVSIAFDAYGYPVTTVVEGSKTVTLKNVEAGKIYYIAVLPGTITLSMKFMKSTGYSCTKTKAGVTLERNKVLNVGKIEPTDEKQEWVDLGLPSGTKWATYNVGASRPEQFGSYFAWGELSNKADFSNSTYKFGNSKANYTKYTSTDGLTVLESGDDAATANWGKNWRMPTKDQFDELSNTNYVTRTWTNNYESTGVKGRILTSKNGNSIFIPAGGYKSGTNSYSASRYWSSTLCSTVSGTAYGLGFDKDNWSIDGGGHNRYEGHCVRPVYVGN